MSLSSESKIDILKTLIQEDRTEARLIRGRIETVVWGLVVASFAITAFVLKPPPPAIRNLPLLLLLSDGGLLLGIVVVFYRAFSDLRMHRKAQEARQDLLITIANGGHLTEKFDPFPDARKRKARLKDWDMVWITSAAIGVMVLKMIITYRYIALP
jgi:hypothetical protein